MGEIDELRALPGIPVGLDLVRNALNEDVPAAPGFQVGFRRRVQFRVEASGAAEFKDYVLGGVAAGKFILVEVHCIGRLMFIRAGLAKG